MSGSSDINHVMFWALAALFSYEKEKVHPRPFFTAFNSLRMSSGSHKKHLPSNNNPKNSAYEKDTNAKDMLDEMNYTLYSRRSGFNGKKIKHCVFLQPSKNFTLSSYLYNFRMFVEDMRA